MGPRGSHASDLSNRATKLRAHTRSQVSPSKALQQASPPTVSAEISRVPILEWGGFLLIPTLSYGAIYCSLSRILTFSKLL